MVSVAIARRPSDLSGSELGESRCSLLIHCEEDQSKKASFWGEHRKIRSVLGAPADMLQHRTG
jgi:hypothetical protein